MKQKTHNCLTCGMTCKVDGRTTQYYVPVVKLPKNVFIEGCKFAYITDTYIDLLKQANPSIKFEEE